MHAHTIVDNEYVADGGACRSRVPCPCSSEVYCPTSTSRYSMWQCDGVSSYIRYKITCFSVLNTIEYMFSEQWLGNIGMDFKM